MKVVSRNVLTANKPGGPGGNNNEFNTTQNVVYGKLQSATYTSPLALQIMKKFKLLKDIQLESDECGRLISI